MRRSSRFHSSSSQLTAACVASASSVAGTGAAFAAASPIAAVVDKGEGLAGRAAAADVVESGEGDAAGNDAAEAGGREVAGAVGWTAGTLAGIAGSTVLLLAEGTPHNGVLSRSRAGSGPAVCPGLPGAAVTAIDAVASGDGTLAEIRDGAADGDWAAAVGIGSDGDDTFA